MAFSDYDKDQALKALFSGLCRYWGVSIEPTEDPTEPDDFSFPGRPPVYVVILPEPEDRQVEIGTLLSYGNRVLVLDEHDLEAFRSSPGGVSAVFLLERWLRDGNTHAARARQQMGITP
jgi:hypothetical protein